MLFIKAALRCVLLNGRVFFKVYKKEIKRKMLRVKFKSKVRRCTLKNKYKQMVQNFVTDFLTYATRKVKHSTRVGGGFMKQNLKLLESKNPPVLLSSR